MRCFSTVRFGFVTIVLYEKDVAVVVGEVEVEDD